ncbi:cytochrome P450 [Xylariales sp. AK1849]|nr:cytochrome P450 [Xylariales sp. AK1849]
MHSSRQTDFVYPVINQGPDLKPLGFLVATTILSLYLLYQWALPKPIPGIPYNKDATSHVLGDVPGLLKEIQSTDGTFLSWMLNQVQRLNSPMIQIFIRPLGRPVVVLSDFRESQDILMRRKEFDRSVIHREFFSGLAPHHHIHEPTNRVWKAHRRLLQDLMSPSFLHNVAGPVIYANASNLIKLWELKMNVANTRPFNANDDIYHAALDAVLGFAFGGNFPHNAIRPRIESVENFSGDTTARLREAGKSEDEPFIFPEAPADDAIKATLDLAVAMEEINGSPLPHWKWKFVERKPRFSRAIKVKDRYIRRELEHAMERLQGEESVVRSAVDHMVQREKKLAEKDGRSPDYLSPTMADETFGFVVAGHETTSTTVLWAMKILADHPEPQAQLRSALQATFRAAVEMRRNPSIDEITGAHIPYLDATMEEILRCAGTVSAVDRQAQCDTEVLGHRIPKGTIVFCLSIGPSMLMPPLEVDESRRSESSQAAKIEGKDRAWDPDDIGVFKPERWLARASSDKKANDECLEFDSSAGPQLAFGLGTRGCFGKRLAYLELRILLTMIMWNFELLPCPKELSGYASIAGITTKPRQCYVRLRKVQLE